jgi:predicted acylesterase/phospholipase RssA
MHVDAAIAPDLSHPVVDVLRRRAAGGSTPGARRDPHRVALVLEGGGMRGVVSAAMSAALERWA